MIIRYPHVPFLAVVQNQQSEEIPPKKNTAFSSLADPVRSFLVCDIDECVCVLDGLAWQLNVFQAGAVWSVVDDVKESWRILGGLCCFGFGSREAQVEALLVSLSNDWVSFPAISSFAGSFGCRVSSRFAV